MQNEGKQRLLQAAEMWRFYSGEGWQSSDVPDVLAYWPTDVVAVAVQVLGRDLVMVPKLIHPLPPNEPRTPRSGDEEDIDEEPPTPHPLNDTWMQARARPPLPPPFPPLHRRPAI